MIPRRLLAAVAVLVLLGLSGCVGAGISEEALAADAEYDWETNATMTITLSEGGFLESSSYRAVYAGNETELVLSTPGLTRSHAVDVRAVQFRYPNGTVVGHEAIEVSQSARRTTIRLPQARGRFGFSGDRRTKELRLPAVDGGRYEVVLPPGHRVGDILLSDVVPRGYETERSGGLTRIVWGDVDGDRILLVRHYSDLDWTLFYGMVAVLSVVALVIYAYYSRQIRKIRAWREAQGLDLDVEDDGDDPPPGFG